MFKKLLCVISCIVTLGLVEQAHVLRHAPVAVCFCWARAGVASVPFAGVVVPIGSVMSVVETSLSVVNIGVSSVVRDVV